MSISTLRLSLTLVFSKAALRRVRKYKGISARNHRRSASRSSSRSSSSTATATAAAAATATATATDNNNNNTDNNPKPQTQTLKCFHDHHHFFRRQAGSRTIALVAGSIWTSRTTRQSTWLAGFFLGFRV